MVKSMKAFNQGLRLFCLLVLVCSAIPLQIRGQTTNKIRSNMLMGVKDGISSGDVKVNVCYQIPVGWYCCSKNATNCYDLLENCTINQGLKLFCLLVLVCSTIPLQTRGQTTNKIISNMHMEVKKGIGFGVVKLNVCYKVPAGYYCCSKDAKCYGTLEVCVQNCISKEKACKELRG
uniref:Uncharacterized protein n=1 Tax=Leersia perrieri TaxID=77586 RepID=A0A0D9WMB4_9ORYZ